jgi:hypothetical protein
MIRKRADILINDVWFEINLFQPKALEIRMKFKCESTVTTENFAILSTNEKCEVE